MKEKAVPSLKKFATATSFIVTFVDHTFEGLIIKSSLVKICFKFGGYRLLLISLELSISYFIAGLPSKIDLLSWTTLNIFGCCGLYVRTKVIIFSSSFWGRLF